jgi:hypothetical protein
MAEAVLRVRIAHRCTAAAGSAAAVAAVTVRFINTGSGRKDTRQFHIVWESGSLRWC